MGRRKNSSAADALLELVAVLPWWGGVLLALASYLVLHHIASQPGVGPQAGQMGVMVTQALGKSLASIGQYILPVICLLGAAISAWRRRERGRLLSQATRSEAADALAGMTWGEFEMLVGEGFRLQGYQVVESGGGGADGGVDFVLTRRDGAGGEKFFVQCKHWRAYRVGVDVVRALYGVMAAEGAAGGFVVTSGRFTDEAIGFASGRNLTLVDGPKLHAMLRRVRATRGRSGAKRSSVAGAHARTPSAQVLACPVCTKPLVRRTAKRGVNAGREFWGCTGYPGCRFTRPISELQ